MKKGFYDYILSDYFPKIKLWVIMFRLKKSFMPVIVNLIINNPISNFIG